MAHYALLDNNNIVTEVITGIDETELIEGKNPEVWYGEFRGQRCKRTSYNTVGNTHLSNGIPFRKNFAAIGFTYNGEFDAFIAPQPYPSWTLNYTTFTWEPPSSKPNNTDKLKFVWFEPNKEWVGVPR